MAHALQLQRGTKNMASYTDLVALLNDIRDFSEENDFPDANQLIMKAKRALKEDAVCHQNAAHHLRKNGIVVSVQRLI